MHCPTDLELDRHTGVEVAAIAAATAA